MLLIITIGLTTGLFISSRSSSDVELSTKIEREAEVFSTSEAAIEDILINPLGPGATRDIQNQDGSVTGTAQDQSVFANGQEFLFPETIPVGETQSIWLSSRDTDPNTNPPYQFTAAEYGANTLTVCWEGAQGGFPEPGIVMMLLFQDGPTGNMEVATRAFRADGSPPLPNCGTVAQGTDDCFTMAERNVANACGRPELTRRQVVNFMTHFGADRATDTLIALRIRPVFAASRIAVQPPGGIALNRQALQDVIVDAQHQRGTGESTRVRIFRPFPQPVGIFDYALFSGAGLTHN
jgi:hypothetical protein